MFNPFNFGARPTPSIPKVFVLRTAARHRAWVRNDLLHPQFQLREMRCHQAVLSHSMPHTRSSQINMLRWLLRSCCQSRFLSHEGHHYPA